MAMERVSRSLSETMGQPIRHDAPRIETVPLASVASRIGDPGQRVVGVYLQIKGDAGGQALLVFSWDSALQFVDLMMGETPGTTSDVGFTERSVLAETGNLALTAFLNALAAWESLPQRLLPSTPDVLVDKLERVLNLALISAGRGDDVLIVETVLRDDRAGVQAHFWVLPRLLGKRQGRVSFL
jgi:chemotaxis protein CheC